MGGECFERFLNNHLAHLLSKVPRLHGFIHSIYSITGPGGTPEIVNQPKTFALQGDHSEFQGQGTDLTRSTVDVPSATPATFPVLNRAPAPLMASAHPTPILAARTAKAKCHPLGDLSNRNVSHSSGGYKSKVKGVLAVLIS